MAFSTSLPASATRLDPLSVSERSERMSRVRYKDSRPEWTVRRLIHSLGYRYRLHSRMLPGRPDLVFPGRRKVIFVHGCFWHRHEPCSRYRMPKTHTEFWSAKLEGNRERDDRNVAALRAAGWDVLVVWECELGARHRDQLTSNIRRFLDEATE